MPANMIFLSLNALTLQPPEVMFQLANVIVAPALLLLRVSQFPGSLYEHLILSFIFYIALNCGISEKMLSGGVGKALRFISGVKHEFVKNQD